MAEAQGASAGRVGRPRVVAAAVEPVRRAAAVDALNRLVASGGSGLLLTADGSARPAQLADDVEVLDLQALERRVGVNLLLSRSTRVWKRLLTSKPYRLVRPWLLWRALRRELPRVRVADVDHVLIVHPNSWPIAWQLHRLRPSISISYEVPEELFERVGRSAPAALGADPPGADPAGAGTQLVS